MAVLRQRARRRHAQKDQGANGVTNVLCESSNRHFQHLRHAEQDSGDRPGAGRGMRRRLGRSPAPASSMRRNPNPFRRVPLLPSRSNRNLPATCRKKGRAHGARRSLAATPPGRIAHRMARRAAHASREGKEAFTRQETVSRQQRETALGTRHEAVLLRRANGRRVTREISFAGRSQLIVYHFMFHPDDRQRAARTARCEPMASAASARI